MSYRSIRSSTLHGVILAIPRRRSFGSTRSALAWLASSAELPVAHGQLCKGVVTLSTPLSRQTRRRQAYGDCRWCNSSVAFLVFPSWIRTRSVRCRQHQTYRVADFTPSRLAALFACQCGLCSRAQTIGTDEHGQFRTAKLKEYPPALCKALAEGFFSILTPYTVTEETPNAPKDFTARCAQMACTDMGTHIGAGCLAKTWI